ncbi:MAG TPA: chemotaxis protein CheX, partial [Phycisphaerae bacterium]|nr:chemotaxis protein CheX [Phycisphaerae bacterium]
MQPTEQTIARVAREVLETMAFALVLPDEPAPPDDGPVVRARVDFEGPFCGSVSLTVPEALVPELAANMLGEDDPAAPSPQQQQDALGELANVMCGNLVQALAGP